jgi:hypothetical protein
MSDDTCIRCRKGKYLPVDREVDGRRREFVLLECDACKSLLIRKTGWDPADWGRGAAGSAGRTPKAEA